MCADCSDAADYCGLCPACRKYDNARAMEKLRTATNLSLTLSLTLSFLLIAATTILAFATTIGNVVFLADILVPFLLLYAWLKSKKMKAVQDRRGKSETNSQDLGGGREANSANKAREELSPLSAHSPDDLPEAPPEDVAVGTEEPAPSPAPVAAAFAAETVDADDAPASDSARDYRDTKTDAPKAPPQRDYWVCRCGYQNKPIANYCIACGTINGRVGRQTMLDMNNSKKINFAPERLASEPTEKRNATEYGGEPASKRPASEPTAIEKLFSDHYLSERMLEFAPKPKQSVDKQYSNERMLALEPERAQSVEKTAEQSANEPTAPEQPAAKPSAPAQPVSEQSKTSIGAASAQTSPSGLTEIINKSEDESIAKWRRLLNKVSQDSAITLQNASSKTDTERRATPYESAFSQSKKSDASPILALNATKKPYNDDQETERASEPVARPLPQNVETLLEREKVLERELLKLRYQVQKPPATTGWTCPCGRFNPPENNFCGTCGRRRYSV
jgi:hypothetical protein